MDIRNAVLIAPALAAASGVALAHHSTAVDFDKDAEAAIEGVVTQVNFVNPHVRFYVDVTNDEGEVENWQIETRPPENLSASGLFRDTLEIGGRVRVAGQPSRRGQPSMWLTALAIEGGPNIVIGAGDEPNEAEDILVPTEWRTFSEIAADNDNDYPVDITGLWGGRYKFTATVDDLEPKPMPATAEALRLREENRQFGKDYALRCIPTGMARIFGAPVGVEIYDQGLFYLFVYSAGGTSVRRIYMDGRSAPDGWPASMLGFSTGRWQGDSLVVETTHLKPMWLDGSGWPMSGEVTRLVETYTPRNNGALVDRTMVIHDPLYTEPLVRTRGYLRSEEPLTENVCDPEGFYGDLLKEGLIEEYFSE